MINFIKRLEHKHFLWLSKKNNLSCFSILFAEICLIFSVLGFSIYKIVDFTG